MDTPTSQTPPPAVTPTPKPTPQVPFYRRLTTKQIVIGGMVFSITSLLLSNLLKRPTTQREVVIPPTPIPTIIVTARQESLAAFDDEDKFVQYVLASEPIVYKPDYIQLLPEGVPENEFFQEGKILPAIPDFAPEINTPEGVILPQFTSFSGDSAFHTLSSKLQRFRITPVSNLATVSAITPPGHSLVVGNKVFVFSTSKLSAYPTNFATTTKPLWTIDLPPHVSPISYRYYRGKILLLTSEGYDLDHPCSIHLLTARSARFNIPCSSIYHPIDNLYFDVLYSAIIIDPENGSVSQPITFTGQRNKTLIYTSENSLYFATTKFKDDYDLYYGFFETTGKPTLPEDVLRQILSTKDVSGSRNAKFEQLQQPLINHLSSLSEADQLAWLQGTREGLLAYLTEHLRDLSSTMIVKVDLAGLKIVGETTLPGMPNNAEAFNQYENNLRIIQSYISPLLPESAISDLYILRPDLGPISTLTDLAHGRKVNTEWFINDKIFFSSQPDITRIQSLDVSNAYQPRSITTLPISGSNFYLFPLLTQRVLALYEKDGTATISLYNVQNSNNPTEISSVQVGPWSEVSDRPYSLLVTPQTKTITVSDDQSTFLLSYSENSLSLFQQVSMPSRSSFYYQAHLYLMGDAKITVVNPQNGQLLKEFNYSEQKTN